MPTHMPVAPPDLSSRPLRMTVECALSVAPRTVFQAWTAHFDRWLAAPGTVLMTPAVNTAFFFETHHAGERHQYYGRFLRLEADRLIECVWLSTGTQRLETLITLELAPAGQGTHVRLTQAGFPDQAARDAHEQAWPAALAAIDQAF